MVHGTGALVVAATAISCAYAQSTVTVSVFPDIPRPEQHPRYGTTITSPATWSTFRNTTRFAALRGFSQTANNTITGYQETLAQYAPLGDVIWPVWQTIFAPNFPEVLQYFSSQGLYMTDLWGFVPGSGPGSEMWQAFTPPAQGLAAAAAILGDAWLGMDVGEQDGRYIGGYADQKGVLHAPRMLQRAYFEGHFHAMGDQLGNRLVALQSLTFAHYLAQAGTFRMVGCEAAQALVNAQLFYMVARGAGKQYGLLAFGNASVYNRFGYKTYLAGGTRADGPEEWAKLKAGSTAATKALAKQAAKAGGKAAAGGAGAAGAGAGAITGGPPQPLACTNQGQGGPTCGTSLSLLAKLMFAQIWYNSGYVSFENGWFNGNNTLSPIGVLQESARAFHDAYGTPGTHMATFALLLDYAAGWTAPRHLYTGSLYRVWGNLPYSVSRGDYLTDSLMRLMYPGYADSSYYHDETGFSAPTPYGDAADLLLSDAPGWLLQRYDTILLAGTPQTEPGLLQQKLGAAVAAGSRVVAFAGALGAWGTAGVAGCSIAEAAYAGSWQSHCPAYPAGTVVTVTDLVSGQQSKVTESAAFRACTLTCTGSTAAATPVAWVGTTPIAWTVAVGTAGGGLVVLGSPYGSAQSPVSVSDPGVDAPLQTPYPMLQHTAFMVDAALRQRTLFTVPGLTYTVARVGPVSSGQVAYTILVSNPTMSQAPLSITSNIGPIISQTEVRLINSSVYSSVGYLPDGYQGTDLGNSTATTIAGVDTRAFRVVVQEQDVSAMHAAAPGVQQGPVNASVRVLSTAAPARRPVGVALNLRSFQGLPTHNLKDTITAYPSLQQYFDTLVVDWSWVNASSVDFLAADAAWVAQQGFKQGAVDFTPGLDLFPTLRLNNNSAPEYAASLVTFQGVMDKMAAMGWQHALFSLHRVPENNADEPSTLAAFADTLQLLVAYASPLNITLHLRNALKSPLGPALGDTATWLSGVGLAGKLRQLPNTGSAVIAGDGPLKVAAALTAGPGTVAFLGASCPLYDVTASAYTDSAAVSTTSGSSVTCSAADAGAVELAVKAACAAGTCIQPAAAGHTQIVLMVDAYTGPDAWNELVDDVDATGGGGAAGSGAAGSAAAAPGAALDLAYQEVQWLLQAAA